MDVSIPCPCPESPHESDTVTLFDKLDFHRATSVQNLTTFVPFDDPDTRAAEVLAALSEGYMLFGIERWTLRDGNKAIPVTKPNIRTYIIERPDIAPPLVEAADELYAQAILLPLATRALNSSQPSPTNDSTSAKRGAGVKRPKPSKRSSISTIPTDATATTSSSLDGVSSFSQSSESAA